MSSLALCLVLASGVVLRPVANLYSAATEDTSVVSQAIYGTNLELLETRDAWARVRTPDDYRGWMPLQLLRRGGAPYAAEGKVATVWSLFANLYPEPSVTRRQPLLTVPFETRLEVASEPEKDGRRWLEVRLVDGAAAWVQRGDLAFDPAPLSIPETIQLAKRFLGLPYLWGGTSTFGYDCSGFTQMLFRRRGIPLPRDAQPQADWDGMLPIERNALQPGDLLYFGPSPEKITHTGLYIGSGEFIHATTHQRPLIQISLLDQAPWPARLVACRRSK